MTTSLVNSFVEPEQETGLSQVRVPSALRKTFLGCKIGKRLGEDLNLKGTEIEFAITGLLKLRLKKRGWRE